MPPFDDIAAGRPTRIDISGPALLGNRMLTKDTAFTRTEREAFALGGLPNTPEHIESMSMRRTPKALAVLNMAYVLAHQKELQEIGAASAGMQFFADAAGS